MKKNFIKRAIVISLSFIFLMTCIYVNTIDTKYASKYAEVFGSFEIKKVDRYLTAETKITYRGETNTYKNLRQNVIEAFEEKKYIMKSNYSYGYADDSFLDSVCDVGINAYADCDIYESSFVSMKLKRKMFVLFEVESIESDDDFFGYLFFGYKK